MRKIDPWRLVRAIAAVPPDTHFADYPKNINPYLFKNVVLPYLEGHTIEARTLDFSAFSAEDVHQAQKETKELADFTACTLSTAHCFRALEPVTQKKKTFC